MISVAKNWVNDKLAHVEDVRAGRKLGVWILVAIAAVTLILSLPFISWFYVVNEDALYQSLRVSADNLAQLKGGYSAFNILSFVQYANAGKIGLPAMLVMVLMFVAVYFQIALLVKILGNLKGKKGNLGLYGTGEAAMLFNILLCLGAIAFTIYSNARFEMTGFFLSPVVYVILVASIIGFAAVKKMQLVERSIYHEHGLWVELKKNWVLFLMLVPTFIYFLINNYLPMIGVYYAFTNFNFRDGLWASPFVGMKNFDFLIKADLFRLTRNTILYNLVFIVLGNVLQILFAILVSQVTVKWFKKTSQTLMFMPYFVSFVILKVIIYNVFEYQYGVINNVITSFGGERIDFYNTPIYWPFLITLFYIWKNIGYGMVVYLATIMGIDAEMYEAAKVDGQTSSSRFVTLRFLS